jgi:hypothetical protein
MEDIRFAVRYSILRKDKDINYFYTFYKSKAQAEADCFYLDYKRDCCMCLYPLPTKLLDEGVMDVEIVEMKEDIRKFKYAVKLYIPLYYKTMLAFFDSEVDAKQYSELSSYRNTIMFFHKEGDKLYYHINESKDHTNVKRDQLITEIISVKDALKLIEDELDTIQLNLQLENRYERIEKVERCVHGGIEHLTSNSILSLLKSITYPSVTSYPTKKVERMEFLTYIFDILRQLR